MKKFHSTNKLFYNKKYDGPFIIHYDVKDDNIIIKYLSGEEKSIPYSKENELLVLNEMKKQTKELISNKHHLSSDIDFRKRSNKFDTLFFGLCAYSSFTGNLNNSGLILASSMYALLIGGSVYANSKDRATIKELDKYEYFLNNEELINNEEILNFLNAFDDKIYNNKIDKITINDLDDYSLDDLKTMVDIVEDNMVLKKA